MSAYVYILASGRNGTLYIGVTTSLPQRIHQHRQGYTPGFASRYRVYLLVYAEAHERIDEAIAREKQLKTWKIDLIEASNPEWQDLSAAMLL